ncbi:MAG TPA: aminoglycoside phosphotransferase family protein [Caldilineaceae bacterium]|nr:aminoglycoside phosphotransferase family protein [Caldilineaceae bacterium]
MSNVKGVGVDTRQAREFLAGHFEPEPGEVALIGEGAWSRCFRFFHGGKELVIRFGNHVDDFQKDQRAYAYASPDLPIPEVCAIGQAFDGYYAISTRAHGVPLESLSAAQWLAVVPSLVSALEAMRTADLSSTFGIGGWGSEGTAPHASWSSHLLTVADDLPEQRTHGWRERLAASPEDAATFTWGLNLLKRVASDSAPRSLIHGDLVNRNVLVNEDRISGVFDWGCSRYGDHLYDLAWFEFWAPWSPQLDIHYLRAALEQRWRAVGYFPEDKAARLMACTLHIGLDHLAYNAYLGDWSALSATAARMRKLVTTL